MYAGYSINLANLQNKTVEVRNVGCHTVSGVQQVKNLKASGICWWCAFMDEIHELTPSKDASMDYRTDFLCFYAIY